MGTSHENPGLVAPSPGFFTFPRIPLSAGFPALLSGAAMFADCGIHHLYPSWSPGLWLSMYAKAQTSFLQSVQSFIDLA